MADREVEEKIGEGLIRIGALTREQAEEILALQNGGDKRLFGEIALEKEFIEVRTLIDYLRTKGV
ncbi:MAG: hypothetical protein E4H36_11110 [Spirochaetales bacterium]|nr:MAG: hypothetical protein E4H36_11110 [Spirochaetales bacterium]